MPQTTTTLNHPLIVGAGLVGTLFATLLARRGHEVTLIDRRPDMRAAGFVGGRSINLAMSRRGWHALELAGLADEVRKLALPMEARLMHSREGELTRQPYGKTGQAIYSVSRGGLNLMLLHAAEATGRVTLRFNQKCLGFDKRSCAVNFAGETHTEHIEAPVVFGADGAFSAVRSSMLRTPRFNYEQAYLEHAYKELHIPPAADGSHRIDPTALHIWPRGHFMMIALPNTDGSFTCTLFAPYAGKDGFDAIADVTAARAFYEREFADSLEHITDFEGDWRDNPVSSLVTVRCSPWHYRKRILLIGDASHAIVPFYGQGMNSGFEDCSILAERLDALSTDGLSQADWEALVAGFGGSSNSSATSRIPDANAIADLALKNFVEMRDRVADEDFLRQKQLASLMHERFGEDFLPVYSQVSFSNTPYTEAQQAGERQEKVLAVLAKAVPTGTPTEAQLLETMQAYTR